MTLIGIHERMLALGECRLVKPGVQAAAISCTPWLDDEACVVSCSWHGENSKCLQKLDWHDYPLAPESVFKTMYQSESWLRQKILEVAGQFGVEGVYWRTEPTNRIRGFIDQLAPYKAIAIAAFLKGEKW
jgi:hypothetical protein